MPRGLPKAIELLGVEQGAARFRRRRVRELLRLLEQEREGIDAEIERLRHVDSVWELTIQGMERRRMGGVRWLAERIGVALRVFRDPNQLREQPEDYDAKRGSGGPRRSRQVGP